MIGVQEIVDGIIMEVDDDAERIFRQNKGIRGTGYGGQLREGECGCLGRPHIMDEKKVAFIMAERLTHENLKSNPWAAYLFMEAGGGWSGKRVYLKKLKEEQNEELIQEICRKCDYSRYDVKNRFVVYFSVENVLPLIGIQEVR
jgi:hypothetical protein